MPLTSSLLQLPLCSQFKSLSLSSTPSFFHGQNSSSLSPPPPPSILTIRNMKTMSGRVVRDVNDKTVSVLVTRLAKHPKYHRWVRIRKKFQAHDPDNRFKVGDMVLLQRSRPISKTKAFIALPVPPRNVKTKEVSPPPPPPPEEIGIPLESQQS